MEEPVYQNSPLKLISIRSYERMDRHIDEQRHEFKKPARNVGFHLVEWGDAAAVLQPQPHNSRSRSRRLSSEELVRRLRLSVGIDGYFEFLRR
ncbi:hypothetical protein J6590_052110 [Homalodisca vitripennis]|nr:hypothetical protein J6590_052110 [Homalodisca vitripennis]